ncbi:MAG: TcpQ domain-containing protein [Alphaproteobacteria bacterium]|nr:TcpQ domain-containing protein [Alphaproteobacteria bacterium]
MPIKRFRKLLHSSCLITLVSLLLGAGASVTRAGFEWTPPPEPVRPAPQKMSPVPVDPANEGMLGDDPQNIMKNLPHVTDKSLPPVIDKSNEKPKLKIKVLTPDKEIPAAQEEQAPPVIAEPKPEEESPPPVVNVVEPATNTHKTKAVKVDLFPMGNEAASNSASADLTPVILPSDPEKSLDDLNAEDLVTGAGKETPEAKAEKIVWSATETFDVIEGFGSDMPLVLALRQIVPSKYAYSIGKDINLGQKVSWEGEKPWNDVLTSTLTPIGISYNIKGNRLHIYKETPQEINKSEEPIIQSAPEIKKAPPEIITPVKKIPEPVAEVKEPETQPKMLASSAKPENSMEETKPKTSGHETSSISRKVILDPGKVESTQDEIIKQVMGEKDSDPETIKIAKKQDAPMKVPVDEMAMKEEIEEPMPMLEAMPETKTEPYTEDITFNPPPSPAQNKAKEAPLPTEQKTTLARVNSKMHVWNANSGNNVKALLEKWSSELDVKLDWQADKKITLKQNVLINGTFGNALKILFDQDTVKNLDYDLVETDSGVTLFVK